jgi:epsilon-lactone hydrolase
MTSIQAHLIMQYFKVKRIINPPGEDLDLEKQRASLDSLSNMFKPLAELKITPINIGNLTAEWIEPQGVTSPPTILYLHGGYYLSGSLHSHRTLAGNIAIAAKAKALIIAYRLAPEYPFPAGLEDAISAYDWLLEQGIPAKHIFLAGDSAGGGLVLSTLIYLREQSKEMPAAGICLSPETDLTMSGDSWQFNAKKDLVLNRAICEKLPDIYLKGTDPRNPLASPLFADLHGFPPLLIQVGSDEFFLSDAQSFADRARQAGVEISLEIWPRMQHVWQFSASLMPEGREAIIRIGEFIRAK